MATERQFSGGIDEFFHDEWGRVWISAAHHDREEAERLAVRYEGGDLEPDATKLIRANLGEKHGEPWLTPAADGAHEFWEVYVN